MRWTPLSLCTIGLVVLAGRLSAFAQDPVANLLPLSPAGANYVAVLRVHDLTNSPRGIQLGWPQKHQEEFLDGSISVPPWVQVLLRTSYVRPGVPGGDWTAALLPLPQGIEMSQLAQREGTELQQIDGHSVVYSQSRNGYFVELVGGSASARVLGGISPATRQDVARWISSVESSRPSQLSDYLVSATQDQADQLVVAIDLHEMLDPQNIRRRLAASQALQNNESAKAALTVLFRTLQGARLAVRVTDQIQGTLQLDFESPIGDEGQYIQPVIEEFINDAGASIQELADAQLTVTGNSAVLSSELSDESFRRLLSLFTTPPPPSHSVAQAAPPAPETDANPRSPRVDEKASLRYFRAINKSLDDLKRAYNRATHYERTAQWHEKFAQRIDNLPKSGVDPELIEYAQHVSDCLRGLAASLQGTGVSVDALNNKITYDVSTHPVYANGADWWWGGAVTPYGPYNNGRPVAVDVNTNLQDVRQQQSELIQQSAPQREQLWQSIESARTQTQEAMVAKYGPTFSQ